MNYDWYIYYNKQNNIPYEEWLTFDEYVENWVKAIQRVSPTGIPLGIQGLRQYKRSGVRFRPPGGGRPEEGVPEEGEVGLQQMPSWGGYGSIVNQRY